MVPWVYYSIAYIYIYTVLYIYIYSTVHVQYIMYNMCVCVWLHRLCAAKFTSWVWRCTAKISGHSWGKKMQNGFPPPSSNNRLLHRMQDTACGPHSLPWELCSQVSPAWPRTTPRRLSAEIRVTHSTWDALPLWRWTTTMRWRRLTTMTRSDMLCDVASGDDRMARWHDVKTSTWSWVAGPWSGWTSMLKFRAPQKATFRNDAGEGASNKEFNMPSVHVASAISYILLATCWLPSPQT